MILWPTVALAGFLALTGLVIALAASSTARFEFERNLAHEAARAQRRVAARSAAGRPAPGRRVAAAAPEAVRSGPETARATTEAARAAAETTRPGGAPEPAPALVGLAPAPAAPATGPAEGAEQPARVGWWLMDAAGQLVAGPFADRVEADWAALAGGLEDGFECGVVHGVRRSDGTFTRRSSPQELAWLTELGAQLDRLGEDWDPLLSDNDALTTLVVEVAAALVEAGLPLHDGSAPGGSAVPTGGVCLTPAPTATGILVSWRQHDRMSVQQVRGADADAAVQATMNAAVACVLAELDFEVEQFGDTGVCIVTAAAR